MKRDVRNNRIDERPICDSREVGGQEYWTVLQKSAMTVNDSYVNYTDVKRIHNGFKLRKNCICFCSS